MDTRRLVVPAIAIAVISSCGEGSSTDGGGAGTTAVSGATTELPRAAETSSGDDASPPVAGAPPDPCTLLSGEEAFALLTEMTPEQYETDYGILDTVPELAPEGYSGQPTCQWIAQSVQLTVELIPPLGSGDAATDAQYLTDHHATLLDNIWTGEPVAGVGDGAEIGGSNPVMLDAVDGSWVIHLGAYSIGDPALLYDRLASTARLVLERLASL